MNVIVLCSFNETNTHSISTLDDYKQNAKKISTFCVNLWLGELQSIYSSSNEVKKERNVIQIHMVYEDVMKLI